MPQGYSGGAQNAGHGQSLSDEARAEAWRIIDARLWFVHIVAKDYAGELAQMDRELESELSR
jgi:hypothetical protein